MKNSNTSASSDPNKKPRTVHIDVYCTGTEVDSDSSSSSSNCSDEKTGSSPQTVFESGKVRITHKRSEDNLPFHMKQNSASTSEKLTKSTAPPPTEPEEINDGLSSGYPSRSSFSGMRDSRDFASSFCSSVPPSWSTMSVSVPDVPDDTSWKDTYSDLGSWSRSSLAQTDSLDFVPRKLTSLTNQLNATRSSIDEQPEIDLLKTPSVQMSDSFEYADSEDKSRILQMENIWQNQKQKQWRSPQEERKQHLQQQKMREYFEKRLGTDQQASNSDSDYSDAGSEKGWSFINDKAVPRRPQDIKKKLIEDTNNNMETGNKPNYFNPNRTSNDQNPMRGALLVDEASRMVTACKSPSILIVNKKMSANPALRAPFTILPGVFTEQREIARKFGRIVDVFKKPGHHIGPAKNPDCTCDHCREYFARFGSRSRARSVDSHSNFFNWKGAGRGSVPPEERTLPGKEGNRSVTYLGYSDF